MGTNYYAVKNRPSVHRGLHIGKSSCGWKFLFQRQNDSWSDPEVHWNSFEEVRDWLYLHVVEKKDYVILSEYDELVSFNDFMSLVDLHQEDEDCKSNPENFWYCDDVNGYRFTDKDFL